ncbi:IS3 family transposase [Ferrimicrobium acidiphilum]|uniref:IS3 family transposase n=1 Tax=Ferrimicrobium acidiphilum TaxID=121039 RepID=UPI003C6D41E7
MRGLHGRHKPCHPWTPHATTNRTLWASLKKEFIYRTSFTTRKETRTAIFDGIQCYKRKRRHSSIEYLSPTCVRTSHYSTGCIGNQGCVFCLVRNSTPARSSN